MKRAIFLFMMLECGACVTTPGSWTRAECEAAANQPRALTGENSFSLGANICCAGYDCRELSDD